jgi:hypothetical protein
MAPREARSYIHDALAVAGRFRQAHVARHHGAEDLVAEVLHSSAETALARLLRTSNMVRSDALDLELRIQPALDRLHGVQQRGRPSSAKYSHCIGTSTLSAAVSAFSVSSD